VYLAYAIAVPLAAGEGVDWTRERIAQPLHVPSAAMFPTLQPGDHLYASRWKIGERQLKRGDVVIVELARSAEGIYPVDQRPDLPVDRFVKRVVGLPGDVIEIRDGSLYVGAQPARLVPRGEVVEAGLLVRLFGEELGETEHPIARIPGATGRDLEPFRVAPDRYFLLGDNRDNSYDSRYYGTVSRAHVVGLVTHLYFSRRPDGGVEWERVGRVIR
jgi:signal peptidase I